MNSATRLGGSVQLQCPNPFVLFAFWLDFFFSFLVFFFYFFFFALAQDPQSDVAAKVGHALLSDCQPAKSWTEPSHERNTVSFEQRLGSSEQRPEVHAELTLLHDPAEPAAQYENCVRLHLFSCKLDK